MPKNDGVSKVQFHKTNLALKMPKWATKTPKWTTCCSKFVAPKSGVFLPIKNAGVKAFMKLTPG